MHLKYIFCVVQSYYYYYLFTLLILSGWFQLIAPSSIHRHLNYSAYHISPVPFAAQICIFSSLICLLIFILRLVDKQVGRWNFSSCLCKYVLNRTVRVMCSLQMSRIDSSTHHHERTFWNINIGKKESNKNRFTAANCQFNLIKKINLNSIIIKSNDFIHFMWTSATIQSDVRYGYILISVHIFGQVRSTELSACCLLIWCRRLNCTVLTKLNDRMHQMCNEMWIITLMLLLVINH